MNNSVLERVVGEIVVLDEDEAMKDVGVTAATPC